MKCQILFSGKNNKKYFTLSSVENFTDYVFLSYYGKCPKIVHQSF